MRGSPFSLAPPPPPPCLRPPPPLLGGRRDYYYIVLELIEGGELFERIQKKDHYSERDARIIMSQLASAMACAHMRNICHRDLKPENILLASKTDDTSLKIADLGFAKVLKGKNQLLSTPCGTPGYVAPEVIANGTPSYTVACDVWSLGVILFILLCGCAPLHPQPPPPSVSPPFPAPFHGPPLLTPLLRPPPLPTPSQLPALYGRGPEPAVCGHPLRAL
jgi:serine/threonine protein kinase